MVDTFITVHSTEQAARLWASQLPHYGQSLISIDGPIQGVKLDDHTISPPENIAYLEVTGSWLVLAKG
jgi:hypothetical protein